MKWKQPKAFPQKCPKGPTGRAGKPGLPGPNGATGARGLMGPVNGIGRTGPRGPRGGQGPTSIGPTGAVGPRGPNKGLEIGASSLKCPNLVTFNNNTGQLNYGMPILQNISATDSFLYCRPDGALQVGAIPNLPGTLCDDLDVQIQGGIFGWTNKDRVSIFNTNVVQFQPGVELIPFDTLASPTVLNCQGNWNNSLSVYTASNNAIFSVTATIQVYIQEIFLTTQLFTLQIVLDLGGPGPYFAVASEAAGVTAFAGFPNPPRNSTSITVKWSGYLGIGQSLFIRGIPTLTPSFQFFYTNRIFTLIEL